jgi:hypothetical protein
MPKCAALHFCHDKIGSSCGAFHSILLLIVILGWGRLGTRQSDSRISGISPKS